MFNDDVLKGLLLAAQERHTRLVDEHLAGDTSEEKKFAIYTAQEGIDQIESLIKGDNIAIIWSIDDVLSLGEDNEGNQTTKISKQEAYATLADVKNNHDASVGVNWDTLWDTLLSVKESNEDGADDNTPE